MSHGSACIDNGRVNFYPDGRYIRAVFLSREGFLDYSGPMFRLIKFTFFLGTIFVVGYLLLGISLGGKTLYSHLQEIFGTQEAQTLKNEIEKKVDDAASSLKDKASNLAADKLREKLDEKISSEKAPEAAPSAEERRALDSLIHEKSRPEAPADDRAALSRLIGDKLKETP